MPRNHRTKYIAEKEVGVFGFFAYFNHTPEFVVEGVGEFSSVAEVLENCKSS
jgi:hypothetical protein